VRIFARDWVECFAAVMLSLTSIVSYLHESYGTATIAALCAGLVAGVQFGKWAVRR
jgi:hypothetical protein